MSRRSFGKEGRAALLECRSNEVHRLGGHGDQDGLPGRRAREGTRGRSGPRSPCARGWVQGRGGAVSADGSQKRNREGGVATGKLGEPGPRAIGTRSLGGNAWFFFLLFRNACFPTASAAKAEARQRPHSRELPAVQAVTAKRHFPLGGTEIPAEGRVCEPEGRFRRPEHHAEGTL